MFQFPPCPPSSLYIQLAVTEYCSAGFPHSGISGSMLDDSSPKLFAAIHALRRLLTPRHPPYALSSLIHARRQSLIRLLSSAQLLRCQPGRPSRNDPPSHLWLASRSDSVRPKGQPPMFSFSALNAARHKNRPAHHQANFSPAPASVSLIRFCAPTSGLTTVPHECGPEWIRTTDPCVISTVL